MIDEHPIKAKARYPVVFKEAGFGIKLSFFDLEIDDCYAAGLNMAWQIAKNKIYSAVYDLLKTGRTLPRPTASKEIPTERDSFLAYVAVEVELS